MEGPGLTARAVPFDSTPRRCARTAALLPLPKPELSSYKASGLRSCIAEAQELDTIMITSAVPGEGKTLTPSTWPPAFAGPRPDSLLVDCDFQRQSVHQYLGVQSRGPCRLSPERHVAQGPHHLARIKSSPSSRGQPVRDSSELVSRPEWPTCSGDEGATPTGTFSSTCPRSLPEPTPWPLRHWGLHLMLVHPEHPSRHPASADLVPKEKFLGFVLNRSIIERRLLLPVQV